jgi:hypothetical protein
VRIFERPAPGAPPILPFGEAAHALPLLDRPLAEWQRVEAGPHAPRLALADDILATRPVLDAFAAAADARRRAGARAPFRLTLAPDHPARRLWPVSRAEVDGALDLFVDAPPSMSLEVLRREAEPLAIAHAGPTRRRELARLGPPPYHLDLPADGAIALAVEHWVHALWAAPLLVPRRLSEPDARARRRRWPGAFVDPTARVHPTADVEASYVGPRATIGAHGVVRDAYVGADARLSDFTKLTRTALGAGVHTLADATFSDVVSLGEGTLTNLLLRDVIVGRRAFLTSGVIFWADTLGEEIVVEHEGRARGTGRRTLGGAIGHGAVLGARTIVGPGLAIPNRTTVVMRREEGVQRIADVPPGTPLAWYDGGLVPYASLAPLVGEAPALGPEELR